MNASIILEPSRISQLHPFLYSNFYLIVPPQVKDYIEIADRHYQNFKKLVMQPEDDLESFITQHTPNDCDILLLVPDAYALGYQNPHACLSKGALANRRMVALRCLSTPASLSDLDLMIDALYDIPMERQIQMVENLYVLGENADYLTIQDSNGNAYAHFNHLSDDYTWHSLYGSPRPGQFVLAPSGETNVIVTQMASDKTNQVALDINGTLILQGVPIVHYGTKPILEGQQQKIYRMLNSLRHAPVEATVEGGKIIRVKALDPLSKPAEDILEHLFEGDELYRHILELGFGLNENLKMSEGNLGTNEFYGGQGGCIHYGLGRVPYTTFHIDIVCPDAQLMTNRGERIFGPDRSLYPTH